MGKSFIFSFIIILYLFLMIFLSCPAMLKLSFTINFILIMGFTYYNIFIEKCFSPFLSVFIVFNFLFFIVAPLVQIDSIVESGIEDSGSFIQGFPFNPEMCIRANFYILCFNLIFAVSYLFFKQKSSFQEKLVYNYNQIPLFLLILFFFTIGFLIINFNSILFQFQHEFYEEVDQSSTSQYLIVQKFLYFTPFTGLIISYLYLIKNKFSENNYKYVFFFFIFFLITIIFLKNPLTEKRNALGPIYITMIFIFFKRFLSNNYKVLRFMFLSMIIAFPALSILTHSRYSLSQMVNHPILIYKNIRDLDVTDAFNSLHYDAYANFLATIDYFDNKTFFLGKQLMCSLFFFVPRSVWRSKPETTGFLIGDYLIDRYNFNFNNLSNPFISEGYINFGFFGIFLFAVILAFVFVHMIKWLQSGDYLKSIFAFYFSIYLIYFLRGDLTSSFAYLTGYFLATVFLPKIILAILNYNVKK